MISDVEDRLSRLRHHSEQATTAVESLHRRQQELDQCESQIRERLAELDRRTGEIEARKRELDEWAATAEAERAQFAQQRQQLDAERAQIAQHRQQLDAERSELNDQSRQLDEARAEIDRQRAEFEHERQEVARRIESLEREHAELAGQNEQLNRESDELRRETEDLRRRMTDLTAERDQQAADFATRNQQRQEELTRLQSQVEEQRNRATEIDAQLQQISQQLHDAQSRLAQKDQELEQTCLRNDTLSADLEATERGRSELQAKVEQAELEVRLRDEQLAQAKSKLVKFAETLDAQRDQIEAGVAAQAELRHREREIGRLRGDLERLEAQARELRESGGKGGVDAAVLAERDEMISQLQARNCALENQIEGLKQAVESGSGVDPKELEERDEAIEKLSQHIRRLKTELEEARIQSAAGGGEVHKDEAHILRRRLRLQQYKEVLLARAEKIERARNTVRERAERLKALDNERSHILEAKATLERAEKKMIRRWARGRAVAQLFWVVMSVILLGAASYFAVMKFWPARYAAIATVQAKARPGFPLTSEQANAWQQVHEQMVYSESLLKVVAERLRQRGFQDLADPKSLQSFLKAGLSYDSPKKGEINFRLIGTGQADTRRILDTYAVAFVSVSNELKAQRTDGGGCKLVVPATVDEVPIEDQRPQFAAYLFGGSLIGAMFVGGFLYGRLRRSSGILSEDADLFEPLTDEARWNEIKGGGAHKEHVIDG